MENKKLKILLEGLDCANCASKIEKIVSDFPEVKEANLNFSFKLLIIKYDGNISEEYIINKVKKVVGELEPEVKVSKYSMKGRNSSRVNVSRCKDGKCSINHGKDGHHHEEGCHCGQDEKGCHCSHESCNEKCKDHEDSNAKEESTDKFTTFIKDNLRLLVGIILFIVGMAMNENAVLLLISYVLIGGNVILTALKNITKGKVFDENFLMTIATIGAILIGQYPEGVAVMLFYEIGEMFQSYAVNKSRRSISDLMDIKAEYANLDKGDTIVKVSPEEVNVGETIIIKPGERVPLDCILTDGITSIDSSALTGESMPVKKKKGDELLAGCINLTTTIKGKVTKEFEESTVARILDLVQNASSKKASTEKFISKFARYYTPIVVICALVLAILPPLIIGTGDFKEWLYRALIFLVVSCPCALVISVPLGLFAGIGGASKKGILIKGGNYLEALKGVDTVVLDKTGTLTKGVFKVNRINAIDISKSDLLKYAAICESLSNHPIAKSIVDEYKASTNKNIDEKIISKHEEVSGKGIMANIEGKNILVGNKKLMDLNGVDIKEEDYIGTIVYIAINKQYKGSIIISDQIKEDSKEAISNLRKIGVNSIVMLTGDSKKVAEKVGKEVGIDKIYSELLPYNKVEILEELLEKEDSGKLAFVGDGINDAPVLARADIGIAMGGIGSDAAIEAADVVLMKDDPSALVDAIKIGRKTNKILWQNIIFALGVKILVLLLATLGDANMWEAVFADVGVTLIAIINSMRALK